MDYRPRLFAANGKFAVLPALLAIAGCHPGSATPATAATMQRPDAIAGAALRKGGAICPFEMANGNPIRQSRSFAAGSMAALVGWSTVADRHQPVPPLAYVVFRSTVPDGSADLFWQARRISRPDLSQSDPRLAGAGYAAAGELPKVPGKYKVLLWVGDSSTQRECDTGETFDLHG
jgi:hypothetical protein